MIGQPAARRTARDGNRAVASPGEVTTRQRRALLNDVTLEHGPLDLFGRFLLRADTAARRRDVTLSFAPVEGLVAVNRANPESWRPLLPIFDPARSDLSDQNCFCILGHNAKGEIVATQAARLYDWSNTNFHDEASSLRLLYSDPARLKGEHEAIEVTVPEAKSLGGAVVFSGGIWYRPDYRGRSLTRIIPFISRTIAYSRWRHDCTLSIMAEEVHKGGMAERTGFSNVGWTVTLRRTPVNPVGDIRCALVWMHEDEMLAGIASSLARLDAQVDAGVRERRAEQHG